MYKYDNLKTLKGFLIKNLLTIAYNYLKMIALREKDAKFKGKEQVYVKFGS